MSQTVISIYSPKGGVGKSTLSLQIADAIVALRKASVLIIDRDSQGSIDSVAKLAQMKGHSLPFETMAGLPKAAPTQDVIILDHSPLIGAQFMPPQGTSIVLLPVQPSFLDFASMTQARDALNAQKFNTLPIINRYKHNVNSHRELREKIKDWPAIGERTIMQSSIGQGRGVFSSPVSHSGVREARTDLSLLLDRIEKELGYALGNPTQTTTAPDAPPTGNNEGEHQ